MKSPIARASSFRAAALEAARPAASSISVCFWLSSLRNMGASPGAGIFLFLSPEGDQSLALGLRQHQGSDHDDHVRTSGEEADHFAKGHGLAEIPDQHRSER